MKRIFLLMIVLLQIVWLTGCGENTMKDTSYVDSSKPSLQLLKNEKVGSYLADSKGMTLYYFTKDEPNVSNCSGKCLENWPAFYAEDFQVPEGFNADDFGTITRKDNGEEQITYKGYPLYYFIADKAKGDVNGQGVNNVWYIVNSDTKFDKSEY